MRKKRFPYGCNLKFALWIALLLFIGEGVAQEALNDQERFVYQIQPRVSEIKVDGVEDGNEWTSYTTIDKLYNHFPIDSLYASKKTEIKLTYSDDYLYVYAKCYDNGVRIVQSLQRDDQNAHWQSDNFTIVLDPNHNRQNGFLFGVNAHGAQIESSLSYSGSRTIESSTWDNKWFSEVKSYSGYWIVEMAIPFRSLRFDKENRNWGINFIRRDMESNYHYTWTQFPLNFSNFELNFTGTLRWGEDIPKGGRFYNLIPYTTFSSIRNFEDENETKAETKLNAGIDAKIALTNSLNLDVTINPDFSSADVDREVTNITRFNIFLPERRNFFLENNDVFSNFGTNEAEPYFSRRIGLNNGEVIPIIYGVRLTGNIAEKTRVGFMNLTTSKEGDFKPQNYTVAAINQQVFGQSAVKAIFVNRQQLNNDLPNDYNRNVGAEFSYVSKNGKLSNKITFHKSFTEENFNKNSFYSFGGNYFGRKIRAGWFLNVVQENFIAEVGKVPRLESFNIETGLVERNGFFKVNPWFQYLFYPKKPNSGLIFHRIRTWHNMYYNSDGSLNDRNNNFAYDFRFKNTSSFTVDVQNREVDLLFPVAFLGSDFEPLPAINYTFNRLRLTYRLDTRKKLSGGILASYGGFFDGTRFNVNLDSNIRFKSWGNLSFRYSYNNIKLAQGFGERELHLLSLNGNVGFSNKMFLKNVIQYNSQSENFSIFTRFQWRYLPMSDLFVIFNENHSTDGFDIKNRGLALKLTYWF